MAEYRPIKNKIWHDSWFLTLKPEYKLIWIFLLTNEYVHISGIYELPEALIFPLTGIENWRFIFSKFEEDGKMEYKEGFVYIKNYLKNQTKQINKKDNIYKAIIAYLQENPKLIKLFNLPLQDPYKGLTQPLPKEGKDESKKGLKVKRIKAETPEALKKQFFDNPLMEKIKEQYPDRDYNFQFDLMVDWWLKNQGKLPQMISAFNKWLSNTKPDELLQAERRRKIEREEQERRQKMIDETPRASQERIDQIKAGMKLIGKPI